MVTIRDLLDSGIEFEGYIKVQCWETENNPEIYYEGYNILDMNHKFLDREVRYIFPYIVRNNEAGITIEVYEK